MRDAGSVTYSAAIESAAQTDTAATPSAFAARVVREATRRGFDRARRRVVLGDGAPWIWNLADAHLPEAIQIVDRFHAKQHLADVAKSIYGATSDLAHPWARARADELDTGNLDAVLTALRGHAPHNDEARKCIDDLERNRARMDYPAFRAAGLCTSTGVVEAGCKVAIGTRCKRAGMHRRRGRDHRSPLLQAERPLRGLLGAPRSAPAGRMTARHLTILTCAPVRAARVRNQFRTASPPSRRASPIRLPA